MEGKIKIEVQDSFTIVSNDCLRDVNLSMQAKGLYSYLRSLPPDWCVYIRELTTRFKNGRDAIYTAMRELIDGGYVLVEATKAEGGKFAGNQYTVLSNPHTGKPDTGKPDTEKPDTEKPDTGNPPLVNTNSSNNLNSNIRGQEPSLKHKAVKRFKKPDVMEVEAYMQNKCPSALNNKVKVQAQGFLDYHESRGWKVGKNPMKSWEAAVGTWIRNDFDGAFKVKAKGSLQRM